jgi:hypothetical protein
MKAMADRGGDRLQLTGINLRCFRRWVLIPIVICAAACDCLLAQTPAETAVASASPEKTTVGRSIELVTRFIPEAEPRAGEPVTFEVAVHWLDLGESLSTRLAEPPTFENFDVLTTSTRSSTRATAEGRRVEEVYSFNLIPRQEGIARVGKVEVLYGPRGEEEEGRLSSVSRDVTVRPRKRSMVSSCRQYAGSWLSGFSVYGYCLSAAVRVSRQRFSPSRQARLRRRCPKPGVGAWRAMSAGITPALNASCARN